MSQADFIKALIEGWNAPFVARSQTKKFTGGSITGRTVANIESKDPDKKVPGRILLGRNITYPTKEYATWISEHLLKEA